MRAILAIGGMIGLDQLVKLWAVRVLRPVSSLPVIDGVFSFTYLENRGAAFSILQNQVWFLALIGVAIISLIFWAIHTGRVTAPLEKWGLYCVIGGALGNMIDRIFRGYVIDLFDFELIHFPVFNVADILICLGVGLFCLYLLFFSEKEKKNEAKN